jgi:hypothetical protein
MNTLTAEPGQLVSVSNLGTLALAFVHVSIALDSSALTTQDQIDLLQLKGGLREELVDGGHLRPLPKPGDTPPPPPGESTPVPGGESSAPLPTSPFPYEAASSDAASCQSTSADSSSDCSASASGD